MGRRSSGIAAIIALLAWTPFAQAQQTTEQYIPVGKSPGISGQYSYIGQIQEVDQGNRTITVAGPEGPMSIKVAEDTRIWLDRSHLRQPNEVGDMADLRPGRKIEIKYRDYETREIADWIKVVVPDSG